MNLITGIMEDPVESISNLKTTRKEAEEKPEQNTIKTNPPLMKIIKKRVKEDSGSDDSDSDRDYGDKKKPTSTLISTISSKKIKKQVDDTSSGIALKKINATSSSKIKKTQKSDTIDNGDNANDRAKDEDNASSIIALKKKNVTSTKIKKTQKSDVTDNG
eukprot:CAMPEP_0119039904 /NCGR_PEP_ID=MMETSP1177-20130426/9653_1 /TAXON_ID=2985 /ORGANISM="Ochromonas sp, Strain CCMP1899" /LENGTH=159 /DNA_ID=CAMNT_0007004389 /DNA_START=172 /DNA_END=648 /DNA_ORIENTATION=+